MTSSTPPSHGSPDRAAGLHPATVAVHAGRPAPEPDAPLNPPAVFAASHLGATAGAEATAAFLVLMEAQRWRLSMFASCAWFWESPERIETLASIRAATRAAQLIDGLAGTALERRLDDDLRHLTAG